MSRFFGIFAVAVTLLGAAWFSGLNAGHRVAIDLGLFRFPRVPIVVVAFAGMFIGMVVMLIAGLHTDLRVRTILRERLIAEDREERGFVDRSQTELFEEE
jgi:hypothetical protein